MGPKIREDVKKGLVELVFQYKDILEGCYKGERGNVSITLLLF